MVLVWNSETITILTWILINELLLPQETASNERHFPRNILQGSWEAMWWAFASMTTLG